MRIAKETWIIAAIGIADLATTLLWVHHHNAGEANPIFAHYLRMGPAWFSVMKVLLLAAPLFLLEWARRRRPRFTTWASRLAIAGYVGTYAVGVLHVNADAVRDYMDARSTAAIQQAAYERMRFPAYFQGTGIPRPAPMSTAVWTPPPTPAADVP